MRRSPKHVSRPAVDYLFADKIEVEGLEHLREERPVFLVLAELRALLGRCFMLQPLEILVAFPLFRGRWRLSIMFHEPFEASAVNESHFGDVGIFRFELPQRVQATILVALGVGIVVARLPTALGRRHRSARDLTGVREARMILEFYRYDILSEECG